MSWVAKTGDGQGEMRVREASGDGILGPVQVAMQGRMSRNSGFPQMVIANGRRVYAWPESGESRQLRTAYSVAD